jgi:hypothetical protein
MPFSTADEPLGKSQFRPVWAGEVLAMNFTTKCFVVRIPEAAPQLTFSYLACAASDIALLALTHGNFSVPILDFLEQRFLNIRMPVAACDKCVVTTGLFILLQATGHGLDPLPGVSDLDIYNWPEDHVRLRRAVTKTQKSLQKISDTSFLRRLERCTDAHLQRGCLNCPLASKFVGIAAKPKGIKRKGTPHAEQPRASPSPAETEALAGGAGAAALAGGVALAGGASAAVLASGASAAALAGGASAAVLASGASAAALAGEASAASLVARVALASGASAAALAGGANVAALVSGVGAAVLAGGET